MKDEIKRVLSYYDIGELKRTYRVEKGVVNDNRIILTVRGRYFLKRRHPEMRDSELIRAQHNLTRHLRHSGFPAPAIIPTKRGETLLILDGEFYEIQEFIEGKSYEQTSESHLIAAATALGLYHTYVQNFTSQALCNLDRLYCPIVLTSNLSILSKHSEFSRDTAFMDYIEKFAYHAVDLSSRLSTCETLHYLVVHGDYHAGNLIYEDDCIVGVVDYDKARQQPRVVELAEALIYFASPRPGDMEHLAYPGFLEWNRITSFLKHYACALRSHNEDFVRRIGPHQPASEHLVKPVEGTWLGEDEVCALPDYIRAIWLCVSIEQLVERDFQTVEVLEALRELSALSDWPSIHRQQLIEAGYAAIRASESNRGEF